MKLQLLVEFNDGLYWGRIEGVGRFVPNGAGETFHALKQNLIACIEDYKQNEGQYDLVWQVIPLKHEAIEIVQI